MKALFYNLLEETKKSEKYCNASIFRVEECE
jgi:hypothetical protein